jgi:hypothetical protein
MPVVTQERRHEIRHRKWVRRLVFSPLLLLVLFLCITAVVPLHFMSRDTIYHVGRVPPWWYDGVKEQVCVLNDPMATGVRPFWIARVYRVNYGVVVDRGKKTSHGFMAAIWGEEPYRE